MPRSALSNNTCASTQSDQSLRRSHVPSAAFQSIQREINENYFDRVASPENVSRFPFADYKTNAQTNSKAEFPTDSTTSNLYINMVLFFFYLTIQILLKKLSYYYEVNLNKT